MPKVRLKMPVREAWLYSPFDDRPSWVVGCTEFMDGELLLVRRSGSQRLVPGDWLVQDLDGEPEWMTDAEMRSNYEEVS